MLLESFPDLELQSNQMVEQCYTALMGIYREMVRHGFGRGKWMGLEKKAAGLIRVVMASRRHWRHGLRCGTSFLHFFIKKQGRPCFTESESDLKEIP